MVWMGLFGLGRCPQGASVYPMVVPTRWWVGAKVGSVWSGHGIGGGGVHLAPGQSRHLGSVPLAAIGVNVDSGWGMP